MDLERFHIEGYHLIKCRYGHWHVFIQAKNVVGEDVEYERQFESLEEGMRQIQGICLIEEHL